MKIKFRFVAVAVAVLLFITFVLWSVSQDRAVQPEDRHAASAIDQTNSKLSPELMEALEKAEQNDSVKVWVEFDTDEYENKTGESIGLLIRQHKTSGFQKVEREAFNEFLPEEIIAVVKKLGGVRPPVELVERRPYLAWFAWKLTPSLVNSLATFPGSQKITLYKDAAKLPNADPVLPSYIVKVAEEYPTHRVKLLISLRQQFSTEPPYVYYSYDAISQVLQKHAGKITDVLMGVKSVHAVAPANLQLLAELCALDEVSSIRPSMLVNVLD